MRRWILCAVASLLTATGNGVSAQIISGTAFAIAPERLVTNEHVIAGCTSVEVIAPDGRRTGTVVDSDPQIDLALLRVAGIKGPTARLRKSPNIRLGEAVMVFGFPLTGSLSSGGNFTSGHISALRGLRDAAGEMQITAPVQPGNSGGPLMDASGLVIGVVQAKLDALRSAIATGDIPQNVNFAVTLEVLADFLVKNRVAFRDGALSPPLDTARVAAMAQSFTYRVECRGGTQHAVASPDTRSKPPLESKPPIAEVPPTMPQGRQPPCTGSPNVWTNCVGEWSASNIHKYVGEFRAGKYHGHGTFTFSSGNEYVGEFKDDKFNGQGTFSFFSGGNYVGEFRDNKLNGRGTLTSASGNKYVGEFRDDNPNGSGTVIYSSRSYSGEFREGKYVGNIIQDSTVDKMLRSGALFNRLDIRETPIGSPAGAISLGDAPLPQKAKVLSTIDTPGYTYIEITQNNKTLWLAAATVSLRRGEVIRFNNGMVMTNFNSKVLNRTFPSVTFVTRVVVTNERE